MPLFLWLGTLLASVVGGLIQFFMGYLTKRIAIIVAVVAAVSTLTIAFFAAILALINSLTTVIPTSFSAGLSLVIPDNFLLCVSSIITAHLIRWVYEWNVKVIQLRL